MNASTLFKQAHKLAKQAASNDPYPQRFGKALSMLVEQLKVDNACEGLKAEVRSLKRHKGLNLNDLLLVSFGALLVSCIGGSMFGYLDTFLASFFLIGLTVWLDKETKEQEKESVKGVIYKL